MTAVLTAVIVTFIVTVLLLALSTRWALRRVARGITGDDDDR